MFYNILYDGQFLEGEVNTDQKDALFALVDNTGSEPITYLEKDGETRLIPKLVTCVSIYDRERDKRLGYK